MTKTRLSVLTIAILFSGILTESCEAGPLLDWWRGLRANNSYRYNAFYQGPMATPNYGAPGMGMSSGVRPVPAPGTTICPKVAYQTVNRVVANYVPFTAFRTEWHRVPTTYYRPVTTNNPQTGCVSTVMQPCTTYQMQARRVPYTTYQTVYRTVQHRVPYTTYVTSYNAGGAAGCTSCGTGAASMPGFAGSYGSPVPPNSGYGLNPNGNYSAPASSIPTLNAGEITPDPSMQRPPYPVPTPTPDPAIPKAGDGVANPSGLTPPANTSPASNSPGRVEPDNNPPVVDDSNRTASLIRGKWLYSPVQHAGYYRNVGRDWQNVNSNASHAQTSNRLPGSVGSASPAFRTSGWTSVNQ